MKEPLDIEDYLNEKGCFTDKVGKKVKLDTRECFIASDKVFKAMDDLEFTFDEWMRFVRYAEHYGTTNGVYTLIATIVKTHLGAIRKREESSKEANDEQN